MVETVKQRLEDFIESKGYNPKIHVLYARISKRATCLTNRALS